MTTKCRVVVQSSVRDLESLNEALFDLQKMLQSELLALRELEGAARVQKEASERERDEARATLDKLVRAQDEPWQDRQLPEDSAIDEAFPTKTGRHDLYAKAMELVGARHSKGSLVKLVNWLLAEREHYIDTGAADAGVAELQKADLERLCEALRPFAERADCYDSQNAGGYPDECVLECEHSTSDGHLTVGDLRRARAVIERMR